MEIEKLAEEGAIVGEGPIWNAEEQTLIWTDIGTGRMFSYDPESGQNTQIHDGFNVGGFMQNKQGGMSVLSTMVWYCGSQMTTGSGFSPRNLRGTLCNSTM